MNAHAWGNEIVWKSMDFKNRIKLHDTKIAQFPGRKPTTIDLKSFLQANAFY